MKKFYPTSNYISWLILLPLLIITPFLIISIFDNHISRSIGLLIISIELVIFSGKYDVLELNNGILSRKNIFRYWSIKVESVTDIINGYSRSFFSSNTFDLILNKGSYSTIDNYSKGISFRDKDNNVYEFPYTVQNILIQDGFDFVSILQEINPKIKFNIDAKPFRGYLGFNWKQDNRFVFKYIIMTCNFILFCIAVYFIK